MKKKLIEINNLNYQYENISALDSINFSIDEGDFIAIVGHNGSGKSTLLNCLVGINRINKNTILYKGDCISNLEISEVIGYVRQEYKNFNYGFPITINEILKSTGKRSKEDILEALDKVGMSGFINRNINALSGGELQKIFIARILLKKNNVLILDEPTKGLDSESIVNLFKTLKKLNDEGVTIIMVTHDLAHLKSNVNKVLSLSKKVLYFGDIKKFDYKLCEVC